MGQKVEDYNASNSRKPTVTVGIAGQGADNQLYLLSVDEVTGKLKVDATIVSDPNINIDKVGGVNTEKGYGTASTGSLRVGAMLGLGSTAVSASNPVPVAPIVGGVAVDPRVVRALSNATDAVTVFQGSSWTVGVSNQITGFALDTTLVTLNTSVTTMSAKLPASVGQKTMVGSLPVVLASDQGSIGVSVNASGNPRLGRVCHTRIFLDYTVTSVTTGSYVQILASLSNTIDFIEIFDSSGQALLLGLGAAASETPYIQIFPGGNGPIPISIPSGNRLSLKAITGTANVGFILINCYSN